MESACTKEGIKPIFDTLQSFRRKPKPKTSRYFHAMTKKEEEYFDELRKAGHLTSALIDQINPITIELMFDDPPVWFVTLNTKKKGKQ